MPKFCIAKDFKQEFEIVLAVAVIPFVVNEPSVKDCMACSVKQVFILPMVESVPDVAQADVNKQMPAIKNKFF